MYLRLPDGRKIFYEILGDRSAPVVCFAHSLSADSGMWVEQVPGLLERGFCVLRVDTRGHGGSDAVAGDYTLEQLADDVARVIEAAAFGPVNYVGLSIGGMFGQAFALKYPQHLRSLTLCDTLPASAPGAAAIWQERIEAVLAAGSLEPMAAATMERWFSSRFRSHDPLRWQQVHTSIVATSVQGFVGCAASMKQFDFAPSLPSLRVPSLVICGSDDPGTPPAENRRLAQLIPGARYEEIAGCRHLPNVEDPLAFNAILLPWLESHGRSTAAAGH